MKSHKDKFYTEEDIGYLERTIKNYKNMKGLHCDDLVQSVGEMTRKCKGTINYITAEILDEHFCKVELDYLQEQQAFLVPPRQHFPYHSGEVFTLEILVQRMTQLLQLRREIAQFLEVVYQRELLIE